MRRIMLVSALIAAATSGPMLLAGCAGAVTHPATMPARVEHSVTRYRIAQFDRGRASHFALCLDPACPSVTPKTPSGSTGPTAHAGTEAATSFTGAPAGLPDTLVIRFESGSAALGPGEARALSQLYGAMRGSGWIAIAGRTDSTGSDAINHRLAWTRARVVADHLRDQLGVAPGRLSWEGRGACCYVGDNRTSIGRQANRRAEVTWHPAPELQP